jgi:methyl-CpG-binding domain protein 4
MITSWKPPKSPHGLLQESLWPNEWKILVSCLLLNLTTRKQVDKVIDGLFKKYPDPHSMRAANDDDLHEMIKSLGLANKRVNTLKRFSDEYVNKQWKTPKELYGCGKYADDAWRIFCRGDWRLVEPNDHALNDYFNFLKTNLGDNNARRA